MTDAQTTSAEVPLSGPTVFIGDSIIGDGDWAGFFPDLDVQNLGAAGSASADVQGRVDEVAALQPATVVLMVGTNDLALRATVEQTVRGIENVLFELRRALPDAQLVVLSVLPREPARANDVRETNIHLRQFAPSIKAEFLDLWPVFADEEGGLADEWTTDRLHLVEAGYDRWAEALAPLLAAERRSTATA